ncbi:radical SAM protein [candidate division KSB1 bacterium]|nr:radical SAM protein [candidate division KSB1 bacterium]
MMHIAFIQPSLSGLLSSAALQPLAFAVLAAQTPPDIKMTLWDERIESIDWDATIDLVGISVETYTACRAYAIADRFRAKGIPVILGGFHPAFAPEEAEMHADSLALGPAEALWPQIIMDFQSGKLEPRYQQHPLSEFSDVRFDRSIFHGKRYLPLLPVQYGRGCRFKCEFCSVAAFYPRVQYRPVKAVIEEIRESRTRTLFFIDDNLFSDPDAAVALFEALIPFKVRWACQTSLDVARHPEILDLMVASGCFCVLVGLESLNKENLVQMKKAWNLCSQYDILLNEFSRRGLMIYATYVFGYDADTPETFAHVLQYSLQQRFFLANFNPLTPMPGTALYQRLLRQDRLLHKSWWLDPDFRYGAALFRPKNMTSEQLTAGCFWIRRQFNTHRSMIRRIQSPANHRDLKRLSTFLMANWITRQEIYRKQGRCLTAPLYEHTNRDNLK